MSASKSDRLGRNPFDRGTYAEAPKAAPKASKGKAKTKAKSKTRAKANPDTSSYRSAPAAWTRMLLNEIDRHAPQAVRDLKICKRVARLAELASARLSRFARHLEA